MGAQIAPRRVAALERPRSRREGRPMLRRTFVRTLAGGTILSAVPTARAAGAPPLVGFLPLGSPADSYDRSLVEAFQQGMREVGLVDRRDLELEVVWTNNELEVSDAV